MMNWILIIEIIYVLVLVSVALRVIYDSSNVTKTLAYLLLIIFIPFIGMLLYFTFGINYRKRKIYSKKIIEDDELAQSIRENQIQRTFDAARHGRDDIRHNVALAYMLLHENQSPLTENNRVKLLINGEEKFPDVMEAMRKATDHIHIEYYIFQDDSLGERLADIMKSKAREGVQVRFIYDAFGSISMSNHFVNQLTEAGVEVFPFYEIHFPVFANRLNYRNHRKIIVIDGQTAYVGGINVSNRYVNEPGEPIRMYWRDTHVRIDGPAVRQLQYHFIADWNFCTGQSLQPIHRFFPKSLEQAGFGDTLVQIAASGPDSRSPSILFSILKAISLAKDEILITTPYFVPGESLLNSLVIASYTGIKVKLLVPGKSDSRIVQAAARSYYRELLMAGVEIYEYQKGFIHAKTMVVDESIAMVGTANMDIRSFDLNFEVNAIIYDPDVAIELKKIFFEDLKEADQIDLEKWKRRPGYRKLLEKTAGLFSPLL